VININNVYNMSQPQPKPVAKKQGLNKTALAVGALKVAAAVIPML
jgi:hypothetical protein